MILRILENANKSISSNGISNFHFFRKLILVFGLLCLFSFCNPEHQMKRPNGVPKEANFDRKKNIYTLNKDQHLYTWYESGKLYADCQTNSIGILHGECTYYFETSDRILSKGNFVNTLKDGLWYWYFPNGNIYYKQNFNHAKRRTDFWVETNLLGNEHGSYERYYEDGKLEERGDYDTGYKSGYWEKYHKNGKLEYTGSYLRDQKIGNWKYYYADGKMEAEENFGTKSEFLNRVTYFPDGGLNCKNFTGKPLECK